MNKTARAGLLTQVISSQLKNDLGGMVSSQLLALGRNMYTKGLDQQDEFDADRTGVALATRAGFDPYGLVARAAAAAHRRARRRAVRPVAEHAPARTNPLEPA